MNFDDISSTQLALPDEMGGLGVLSASFSSLSEFLPQAFRASDVLTTIFPAVWIERLERRIVSKKMNKVESGRKTSQ